jgi:hypothetical protein
VAAANLSVIVKVVTIPIPFFLIAYNELGRGNIKRFL